MDSSAEERERERGREKRGNNAALESGKMLSEERKGKRWQTSKMLRYLSTKSV
jgi:hypothetical protein